MTSLLVQAMWVPSQNGGTSGAANEAWDSWPSTRQEDLKPAAKDPFAELMKVSCSHAHKLSQLCWFHLFFVLSSFGASSENASFYNRHAAQAAACVHLNAPYA